MPGTAQRGRLCNLQQLEARALGCCAAPCKAISAAWHRNKGGQAAERRPFNIIVGGGAPTAHCNTPASQLRLAAAVVIGAAGGGRLERRGWRPRPPAAGGERDLHLCDCGGQRRPRGGEQARRGAGALRCGSVGGVGQDLLRGGRVSQALVCGLQCSQQHSSCQACRRTAAASTCKQARSSQTREHTNAHLLQQPAKRLARVCLAAAPYGGRLGGNNTQALGSQAARVDRLLKLKRHAHDRLLVSGCRREGVVILGCDDKQQTHACARQAAAQTNTTVLP